MNFNDVSFIIPSRNTKDYLKIAYESIRKYYPTNEIIILDESDSDDSWEYLTKVIMRDKENLGIWRNTSGKIYGHTITYDMGVGMIRNPLFTIFHSDMVCSKGYLENLLKHWKPKTVVCATRVEPNNIYPPGKEKILKPFGELHTNFQQKDFEYFVDQEQRDSNGKTTKGIFAPWMMSKEDFRAIGGHDHVSFAPFPTEDSDIFLRFVLAGYTLIQSRDSLCYHFISKGHRGWAKNGVGQDDKDFQFFLRRSIRNYQRKWGRMFSYDEFQYPIVHKVYDVAFNIRDVTDVNFLKYVEPWARTVYVDNWAIGEQYISDEQPSTEVDLWKRVKERMASPCILKHDIIIEFSEKDFMANPNENAQFITNINQIITDSVESNSVMECGIFKLYSKDINDISSTLIKVDNPPI